MRTAYTEVSTVQLIVKSSKIELDFVCGLGVELTSQRKQNSRFWSQSVAS
jgi:hypothetical protein